MYEQILTLQSYVVHGHVGNKASSFPLQLLGWNVDGFNTLQLATHTGYGAPKGTFLSADEIWKTYDGLPQDVKKKYSAVLSGYLTKDQVAAVSKVVRDIKSNFAPKAVWLLDPVLGDNGRLYVDPAEIDYYRDILKSGLADIITPNWYEIELLTGITLKDWSSVSDALKIAGKWTTEGVVVSSLSPGFHSNEGQNQKADNSVDDKWIYTASIDKNGVVYVFKYPKLTRYYTGTGDLFTAMLLDRYLSSCSAASSLTLGEAVSQTLVIVQKVLKLTDELSQKSDDPDYIGNRELRIIESRDLFLEMDQATKDKRQETLYSGRDYLVWKGDIDGLKEFSG